MYFVPQKKGWYQRAVQISPLYRYLGTGSIVLILIVSWFFFLNPWLDSAIQYERATITQLDQKNAEVFHNKHRLQTLEGVATELEQENKMLLANQAENQKEQFSTIFNGAKKAGLSINVFRQEKEVSKEWKTHNYKQLVAQGNLDQCIQFLKYLHQSPHMIQCKEFYLARNENASYTLQCQLQCISVHA